MSIKYSIKFIEELKVKISYVKSKLSCGRDCGLRFGQRFRVYLIEPFVSDNTFLPHTITNKAYHITKYLLLKYDNNKYNSMSWHIKLRC